jgi:hypothetical protein
MSNFILRGLRRLDSKPVRKTGSWTYFDTSLVLFSFFFVALSMYVYISNFREHPMYPEIENIKCDTATLMPASGGNKFNTRDRKLYRLSNGEVLKASFSMKLPVEKDKAPAVAKYYTSAVFSENDKFYICYVLLEDFSLNSYHQVIYFSDFNDEVELNESYISELKIIFYDFKEKIDKVGARAFFSMLWGFFCIFYAFWAILLSVCFELGSIRRNGDKDGEQ